jgi:hypothetical protein
MPAQNPKLEAALKQLRKPGASLSRVASDAHVGRERLSRYVKAVAGAERRGRVWTFNDQRVRQLAIVEAGVGHPVQIRVRGFEDAHRAGLHAYEAGQVLKDPDLYPDFVRRWEGQRIRDVSGRWHVLSTYLNQLFIAILTQDYSFERFYQIET